MTTAERIEAIRARVKEATPGPWHWVDGHDDAPWTPDGLYPSLRTVQEWKAEHGDYDLPKWILDAEETGENEFDMDFIAHAREDIPFLLAELDRATTSLRAIAVGALRGEDPEEFATRALTIARAALGGKA